MSFKLEPGDLVQDPSDGALGVFVQMTRRDESLQEYFEIVWFTSYQARTYEKLSTFLAGYFIKLN